MQRLERRLSLYGRNLERWSRLEEPTPLRGAAVLAIANSSCRREFYVTACGADVEAFGAYGAHRLLPATEGEHLDFVNRAVTGRVPELTARIAEVLEEAVTPRVNRET